MGSAPCTRRASLRFTSTIRSWPSRKIFLFRPRNARRKFLYAAFVIAFVIFFLGAPEAPSNVRETAFQGSTPPIHTKSHYPRRQASDAGKELLVDILRDVRAQCYFAEKPQKCILEASDKLRDVLTAKDATFCKKNSQNDLCAIQKAYAAYISGKPFKVASKVKENLISTRELHVAALCQKAAERAAAGEVEKSTITRCREIGYLKKPGESQRAKDKRQPPQREGEGSKHEQGRVHNIENDLEVEDLEAQIGATLDDIQQASLSRPRKHRSQPATVRHGLDADRPSPPELDHFQKMFGRLMKRKNQMQDMVQGVIPAYLVERRAKKLALDAIVPNTTSHNMPAAKVASAIFGGALMMEDETGEEAEDGVLRSATLASAEPAVLPRSAAFGLASSRHESSHESQQQALAALNFRGTASSTQAARDIPSNEVDYSKAHSAELATWRHAAVERRFHGYSGAGYVTFFRISDDAQQDDRWIEWSVRVPSTNKYHLTFTYSLDNSLEWEADGANEDKPMEMHVNGVGLGYPVLFAATNSWTTWSAVTVMTLLIADEPNKIRLKPLGNFEASVTTGSGSRTVLFNGQSAHVVANF
ncbi:hypothetical protein CYMTET_33192 [Cymbomonas tetramitiformis]|uniref:Uncharacterized protein n=1 Tax=Cymbomonas tetramitiformis TaxID=36881 RepID=A0AAE0KR51_9CHLO|nr:hypothetical protein CYMTET_33192 [Cymbomonas tetramitiformis]